MNAVTLLSEQRHSRICPLLPHLEQLIPGFTHMVIVKVERVALNNWRAEGCACGHCLEMTSLHFHLHLRRALMSKSRAGELQRQICEGPASSLRSAATNLLSPLNGWKRW